MSNSAQSIQTSKPIRETTSIADIIARRKTNSITNIVARHEMDYNSTDPSEREAANYWINRISKRAAKTLKAPEGTKIISINDPKMYESIVTILECSAGWHGFFCGTLSHEKEVAFWLGGGPI